MNLRLPALLAAFLLAAALPVAEAQAEDVIGGFFQHLFGGPPQPAPAPKPDASPSPRPSVARKPKKKPSPPRDVAAPAPSAPPPTATKFVYVLGDSLAISAAEGMADDLSAKPDIGVLNRARDASGLVRDDYFDWPKAARDLVAPKEPAKDAKAPAPEKPAPEKKDKIDFVVVMLGINDMQAMKDGATYVDPLSDRWKQLYAQRIQAVVAPLRAAKIPVVWVGLPPMRSEKVNAEMIALNQMFKENAEKAGAKFLDIFDDFADQSGGFDAFGPNLEGQKVKLRGGDGIHLTPAGGKKLAHFLDAQVLAALGETVPKPADDIAALPPDIGADINEQIRREMGGPPAPAEAMHEPAPPKTPEAPPQPAPKPESGAVASLAARPVSPGALLLSPATAPANEAVQALRRGEPATVAPGRADDFSR